MDPGHTLFCGNEPELLEATNQDERPDGETGHPIHGCQDCTGTGCSTGEVETFDKVHCWGFISEDQTRDQVFVSRQSIKRVSQSRGNTTCILEREGNLLKQWGPKNTGLLELLIYQTIP